MKEDSELRDPLVVIHWVLTQFKREHSENEFITTVGLQYLALLTKQRYASLGQLSEEIMNFGADCKISNRCLYYDEIYKCAKNPSFKSAMLTILREFGKKELTEEKLDAVAEKVNVYAFEWNGARGPFGFTTTRGLFVNETTLGMFC
jgi:hypothetical protein